MWVPSSSANIRWCSRAFRAFPWAALLLLPQLQFPHSPPGHLSPTTLAPLSALSFTLQSFLPPGTYFPPLALLISTLLHFYMTSSEWPSLSRTWYESLLFCLSASCLSHQCLRSACPGDVWVCTVCEKGSRRFSSAPLQANRTFSHCIPKTSHRAGPSQTFNDYLLSEWISERLSWALWGSGSSIINQKYYHVPIMVDGRTEWNNLCTDLHNPDTQCILVPIPFISCLLRPNLPKGTFPFKKLMLERKISLMHENLQN